MDEPILRPSRAAFTLIELLVVVAIIALLISILLPALNGARRASRQTLCGTNQRTIGIAILQYAEENREYHHAVWDNEALRFRPSVGQNSYLIRPFTIAANGQLQETDAYWAQLYDEHLGIYTEPGFFGLNPGIGTRKSLPGWQITRCPESEYTLPAFRNNGALPHDPYTIYSSYCFNGVTPGFDEIPDTGGKTFFERSNGQRVPRKLSKITNPSRIIMFQDGSEVMIDGNGDTLLQLDQWTSQLPGDEKVQWIREYFRHPGGSAVAWADGHVTLMSEAKAATGRRVMMDQYGTLHGVPLIWYSTPY